MNTKFKLILPHIKGRRQTIGRKLSFELNELMILYLYDYCDIISLIAHLEKSHMAQTANSTPLFL